MYKEEIEKIIKEREKSFLKHCENKLMLSDNDIEVFKKYDINYASCKNLNELLFIIESVLNNSGDELEDLELISERLGEYNYYNYTNK